MKKIIILLILSMSLATACTANLKMSNLKIDKSLKPGKPGKTAIISTVNYFSGNTGTFSSGEDIDNKDFKQTIANAVFNSGSFENVAYTEEEAAKYRNKKNVIYLDFKVYSIENGSMNWWLAWPGIYPCPAWWPLQPKKGTVAVNLEVSVSEGTRHIKTFKLYESENYDITFYGFFKTAPINYCAEKALLNITENFSDEFSNLDKLPGKNGDNTVLIGTINSINGSSDIIIQHSDKAVPKMGELLYVMSGNKKIELIAMFPMMTSTKCRIVKNSDYSSLKKTMEVFK